MNKRRKLTQEKINEIRNLRRIGLKMRVIASYYEVTIPTIKYHTMGLEQATIPEVLEAIAA